MKCLSRFVSCCASAAMCLTMFALFGVAGSLSAQVDPGLQPGPSASANPCAGTSANHGAPLPFPLGFINGNKVLARQLSSSELNLFCAAVGRFQEIDSVKGVAPNSPTTGQCTPGDGGSGTINCNETGVGLGPRFNGNSCAQCHSQPTVLGASPATNPQIKLATLDGAKNTIPPFISINSAIREARFINVPGTATPDGNVHPLFVITGRTDATNARNINGNITSADLHQPNFSQQQNDSNIVLRIPIQTQGDGLVELIGDDNLEDNLAALSGQQGVSGRFNRSGNDGTITRFGWKAQNKSMLIFSGEAYNVEQGVSNELFPNEREVDNELLGEDITNSLFNPLPDDTTNVTNTFNTNSPASDFSSDAVNFAEAMRLSAPPTRTTANFSSASLSNGQTLFRQIGCNLCHSDNSTGKLVTIGTSSLPSNQGNQPVLVFSDLAFHSMGGFLADGVSQGLADGSQFRSAPLWGLGQRIFLLHDGRTRTLLPPPSPSGGVLPPQDCVVPNNPPRNVPPVDCGAIEAHLSNGSEAFSVINNFNQLSPANQQDLLNFLRSL